MNAWDQTVARRRVIGIQIDQEQRTEAKLEKMRERVRDLEDIVRDLRDRVTELEGKPPLP